MIPMHQLFFSFGKKWFYITLRVICLRVICLSLPSTGIITVSKIALYLSELKTEKSTGASFQADLNYGNDKIRFSD